MSAPRRILLVNTERGWRGGENQVMLLARGLDRARFDALAVCQQGEELARRLAGLGLPVAEIRARGGVDIGAMRALRALMRAHGAELVHAHAAHAHALSWLARLGGPAPLLVTRRVDFPIKANPLSRWRYRACARVVAVSEGVAAVLREGGVDGRLIRVILDGVDPARFASALDGSARGKLRAELGLAAQAVVFGIVAHLVDHKDHRTLLAAFKAVESQRPDAHLVIAGDGELRSALEALARELGLARVRFLGHREDVATVLADLDACIMSSHHEGLGSSAMEAMFAGLPLVATRVGGLPELVVDGQDGLLVPARDPAALAAALVRLAESPALRARMGRAARAKAQSSFSAERMVRAHEALYDDVLGPRA
jgi:glycosyltransferase involved in cell wall biosynthesis